MPKKLSLDSLRVERESTEALLQSAKDANDIVGELQFSQKITELDSKINELSSSSEPLNKASVALFFGGKPVFGSKGIASTFAGAMLDQFQELVTKLYAQKENGGNLAEKGSLPFKPLSELMLTGVASGSFGFILDEMSDQSEFERSELSVVIEHVTDIILNSANDNSKLFDEILEELDPRTFSTLKELFSTLDKNQATLRLVESDRDVLLDEAAISRARNRTESSTIEEFPDTISGTLLGILPDSQKFEIKTENGEVISGTASKHAVEQFVHNKLQNGTSCRVSVTVKSINPLRGNQRTTYRLNEFLNI